MEKIKLTAEQKKVLAKEMQKAKRMSAGDRELFIAQTIGDVYDVELPVNELTSTVADIRRAEVGEHVYYNVPTDVTKSVRTISANCNLVDTKVTPNSRNELAFTHLVSEVITVCINDWIEGDHNVLELNADMIMEALNRQELYNTIQLIDAGAVSEGNIYTLQSNASRFQWTDLLAMTRSVAKYGRKLVLVTGGEVTTDIKRMNFDADKNQSLSIFDLVDSHIPIEECSVSIDTTPTTVMEPDVAYVIAVSDSKNNKPQLMARRKTSQLVIDDGADGLDKERVVFSHGTPFTNDTPNITLSKGFVGYESYGQVSRNDKVYAKFSRT